MKIADIDDGRNCPTGWQQITSPVRACIAGDNNPGCYSALFANNGVHYNDICGKVVGYQKATPDGFHRGKSIDDIYADGISLTYGTPRKHIWSYVNGHSSHDTVCASCNCPCANNPGVGPPIFYETTTTVILATTLVYPLLHIIQLTFCGMVRVALEVITAAHRLACHGFTDNSHFRLMKLLKQEFVVISMPMMKKFL